jgi:hypothetical protein
MAGYSCTVQAPNECCKTKPGFAHWFCSAVCVLCCLVCTYEHPPRVGLGRWKPWSVPVKEAVTRNYPTVQPAGDKFNFTQSMYGSFIPIVFGTDKLNGNVFWSNGFSTKFITVGGETFYYTTTSFALGICEGEIDALLRLWVGEQLIIDNTLKVDENGFPVPTDDGFILGATIDLTDPDSPTRNLAPAQRNTRISVFTGSETQIPEGVMAAKEGYHNTPAYRGLAYILFENFIVTESSVPNIMAEVAANSNPLFPRLYGQFPTPIENFDEPLTNIVTYDPSYDMFTIAARDTSGGGAIPNGRGLVSFSGNTLSQISQHEVQQTFDLPVDMNRYASFVLQTGKHLLVPESDNIMLIYNPFTGQIEGRWGPTSENGKVTPEGVDDLRNGTCTFVETPPGRAPQDIVFAMSFVSTLFYPNDRAFSLIAIDDKNEFTLLSHNASVITKDNATSTPIWFESDFVTANPTFADGVSTRGTHIIVAGYDTNELEDFHIYRITVSETGSLTNPNAGLLGTISLGELGGVGHNHKVLSMFVDPADNCLVLLVTAIDRTDRIVKYNPFTGQIVWSTPCNFWDNANLLSHQQQIIAGPKFAFMSAQGHVQAVDLTTGEVSTVIAAPGDQQLPTPFGNIFQQPYYNGLENSITYIANDPGQFLVKVFLERTDRTTVPVSDIVSYLLRRVGVSEYDIDVTDLSALTLRGYTINQVTSLRSVFAELTQVFRFDVVESNGQIAYKTRGSNSVVTIPHTHLGAVDDNGHLTENQENEFGRTRKINLTYRDIDREYDQNVQSVFFPKWTNTTIDDDMAIDVTVPVVLDATTAKKLAEILLYSKIVAEQTYDGVLKPSYGYLDPGDVVTLDLEDGPIQVRLRQTDRGADRSIQFRATKEDQDIYNDQVNLFGNIGRYEESQISPMDPRVDPFILDIPYRSDEEAASTSTKYLMFLTLLNQRVSTVPTRDLSLNINDTAIISVPTPVTFPTWGYTMSMLEPRTSFYSTDYKSVLRVKMVSQSGAVLGSVTKDTLLSLGVTCNLAYCGGELIQFENAVHEGDNVWAFTNIQRCRLGTEMASVFHAIGERFILLGSPDGVLDEGSIAVVQVDKALGPRAAIEVTVNNNNPFQPQLLSFYTGMNLRPWSVASFKTEHVGDDVHLSWKRRLRYDGQYADDGSEALPLLENPEQYRFYLFLDRSTFQFNDPSTYLRSATLTSPEFIYTDAMAIEDGIDIENDTMYCLIAQTGTAAGVDDGAAFQFTVRRKKDS